MKLYGYSGAGNTFVVTDGRRPGAPSGAPEASAAVSILPETVRQLCSLHGTDGLMVLRDSVRYDFRMEFFNPDGSTGMMCGNGGRCIAAFAANLGITPAGEQYVFEAPDGVHTAGILGCKSGVYTVRLSLKAPSEVIPVLDGWFLDTGARHFVRFVPDVEAVDVDGEGRALRHHSVFAPEGTNVDFVQLLPDGSVKVRTFEKGVERETLACGTGITASAIVSALKEKSCPLSGQPLPVFVKTVHAREADLTVENTPEGLFLTGPACEITLKG